MKLLLDENLSPKLARAVADLFPDSLHVEECGLGGASDEAIWQFARVGDALRRGWDSFWREARSPNAARR